MSTDRLILFGSCMLLALLVFGSGHAFAIDSSPSDITIDASASAASKITTILLKNPASSDSQIYELDIYAPDGIQIKTVGGPLGWTLKIKDNTAIFYTKDKPIISGQQAIFSITTDLATTAIAYDMYDSNDNLLASDIIAVSTDYVQPTYVNDLYGFSMAYPQGWFEKENANLNGFTSLVAFLGPSTDEFRSNINVKTSDMQGLSFSEYVQGAKDGLATALAENDYILLDEGKTTINGNAAYFLEYTISAGTQVKLKTVLVEYGNTIFIVSYAAQKGHYADNLKSFDTSVSTLQITKDIHKDKPRTTGTKT